MTTHLRPRHRQMLLIGLLFLVEALTPHIELQARRQATLVKWLNESYHATPTPTPPIFYLKH